MQSELVSYPKAHALAAHHVVEEVFAWISPKTIHVTALHTILRVIGCIAQKNFRNDLTH